MVALDPKGFVLSGADPVGRGRGLETRVDTICAVRDVRAGAIKCVAAALGKGAQVVAAVRSLLTSCS
jgi:thioredoxin reductase (NADPH)